MLYKVSKILTFLVSVGLIIPSQSAIIDDCKAYAQLFRNTCTGAPTTAATFGATFTGKSVICSNMEGCPAGGGTAPNCNWTRKLCVTCTLENNKVYMRVQSNGLPDHCYGGRPNITETNYDVKFIFNPSTSSVTPKTFSSQSDYDNYMCQPAKANKNNIPSVSEFTNILDSSERALDGVAGFAINGLPIYTASSAEKTDPYYPQNWTGSSTGKVEVVDACIGHPDFNGSYHYHMLPPCLVNAANMKTNQVCDQVPECRNDLKGYAMKAYGDTSKKITYIGIAKDGHFIIGPFDDSGNPYDCKTFDQCGGVKLANGNYAYVFTNVYPYSVGCFGPGGDQKYAPSCSTNTCFSQQGSDSVQLLIKVAFTLIVGMAAYLA